MGIRALNSTQLVKHSPRCKTALLSVSLPCWAKVFNDIKKLLRLLVPFSVMLVLVSVGRQMAGLWQVARRLEVVGP